MVLKIFDKNPNCDEYHCGLASMVLKIFDKKLQVVLLKK